MTTMSEVTPTQVKRILEVFVDEFLVDVPADHSNGRYMLHFDEIVDHVNDLSDDDLQDITSDVNARYAL